MLELTFDDFNAPLKPSVETPEPPPDLPEHAPRLHGEVVPLAVHLQRAINHLEPVFLNLLRHINT